MKKNLLMLALVLAFLCGGLFVSDAKASGAVRNGNSSAKNAEINKKFAKLKLFCSATRGAYCDIAINGADNAARIAMGHCREDMSVCQAWQDWAINVLNGAVDVCLAEQLEQYPVAVNLRKTELDHLQGLLVKEREMVE